MERVSRAKVMLETPLGRQLEVKEVEQGYYKINEFSPKPGYTYRLIVESEGITYSASSTLNPPVQIDSLNYEYYNKNGFFDDGYRVTLYLTDPGWRANYYRVKVYKNGVLNNDADNLIVFDDRHLDGLPVQVRLPGIIFNKGDTAGIQLISIDKSAWEYLSTFEDVVDSNPGSPAPANPLSNFDNGALGYFSAWSYDSQVIIIGK